MISKQCTKDIHKAFPATVFYSEEKRNMAAQMIEIGLEYIKTVGNDIYDKKAYSPKKQLKTYIKQKYNAAGSGIAMWILWLVVEYVLNWVVQYIIDNYLPSPNPTPTP